MDKNLSLNLYEYLVYSQDKTVRGVSLITDKQSIFYTQFDNSDITHDKIYTKLENKIHPNDVRDGFKAIRDNNIHIASVGHELVIYLPDNKLLSLNQYKHLCSMLNQVDKFNKENNTNILLYATYPRLLERVIKTRDTNEFREKIYSLVTKEFIIDEEIIIGSTLENNSIIESMMYHIDLENAPCLLDIKVSLKRCDKYYNDSYYKKYLLSIFPNFLEVYSLINRFNYDDLLDDVSNVDYNNVKDILLSKLNDYSKQK